LATFLRRVREAALTGESDADLLRRFTTAGGAEAEAAFAVLVRRHGPLVMRACRASLRHAQDAEDAFQATFLVLAAKARSLHSRPFAPWLFEVARRVCAHARTTSNRRRVHEMRAAAAKPEAQDHRRPDPDPDLTLTVLTALGRLPEKYRAPILLCDLDGLSYQQAADRLGLSHAAVRNRLARARERLRAALRGVELSVLGPAPAVSRKLAEATAHAAVLVSSGTTAGVSPALLALMNGGLATMMTKMKSATLMLISAATLAAGAYGLNGQSSKPEPAPSGYGTAGRTTGDIVDVNRDPVAELVRIAREVQKRREAGDVAGAKKALRGLLTVAFDCEGALDGPSRPAVGTSAQSTAAPVNTTPASSYQRGTSSLNNPNQNVGERMGNQLQRGGPDVEARLDELEKKLDRLMKLLERPAEVRPGKQ
jgi:RNA polymerase sigma factor (sigma-70 family)